MEKLDNKNEKSNQFDWLLSDIENILSNTPKDENKKEYLLKYLAENYGQSLANMILENLPAEMFKETKDKELFETFRGLYKNTLEEEIKRIEKMDKISKIKNIDGYSIFPSSREGSPPSCGFSVIEYKDGKITFNNEGPHAYEWFMENNPNRKFLKELTSSSEKETVLKAIQENTNFQPTDDEILFHHQGDKEEKISELKETYNQVLEDVDSFNNNKENHKYSKIEFNDKELQEYGKKLSNLCNKLILASSFIMKMEDEMSTDTRMIDAYREFLKIYEEIEPAVEMGRVGELILTKIKAENLSKGIYQLEKLDEKKMPTQRKIKNNFFLKNICGYKSLDFILNRLQLLKHLEKITNNKDVAFIIPKDDIDKYINEIREAFLRIDLKIQYMEIFKSTKDYEDEIQRSVIDYRINDPADPQKEILKKIDFGKAGTIEAITSFGYEDLTENNDYQMNKTDRQTRLFIKEVFD